MLPDFPHTKSQTLLHDKTKSEEVQVMNIKTTKVNKMLYIIALKCNFNVLDP